MLDEQADRSLFLAPPEEPARHARPAEPPAGPAAPLVEVEGGRRRWLAVLVVVALLVAGAVANRRSAQQVDPPPEPAAVEEAVAPPAPVLLAPSLRTMDPQPPVDPPPSSTGTTLAVAASTQLLLVEVDSGTVRNVQIAALDASGSYPWGSQVLAVGDSLVVRSQPPRAFLVPRADGGPVAPLDAGSGGGLYPSEVPGRFWVDERRGEPALTEVDLEGARARSVPVLDAVESIVWDGSGFIQSAGGTAFATPEGAEPAVLAPGTAVAADAAQVALLRCGDGERCDLSLLDRATGVARAVAPPRGSTGFLRDGRARLSPDGRWLLVTTGRPTGDDAPVGQEPSGLAVVDVAAASVRALEPSDGGEPAVGAFSPSSRWLFLASSAGTVSLEVAAIDLEEERRYALATLEVRGGFGLVLEALPSVPADLGAGS